MSCIHQVTVYEGHFITDTFWRVVDFLRKIKDRLVSSLQDLGQIVIILWPITRHARNGMQMRIAGPSSTGKQGQEQTPPNLIKAIFSVLRICHLYKSGYTTEFWDSFGTRLVGF